MEVERRVLEEIVVQLAELSPKDRDDLVQTPMSLATLVQTVLKEPRDQLVRPAWMKRVVGRVLAEALERVKEGE